MEGCWPYIEPIYDAIASLSHLWTYSMQEYSDPLCIHMVIKVGMNSMKLVIPLHSLYSSIHTKDESKRGTAFAFIFGVN